MCVQGSLVIHAPSLPPILIPSPVKPIGHTFTLGHDNTDGKPFRLKSIQSLLEVCLQSGQ